MPLTVTRLARACHLARSTVLYYESIGLLKRPRRTSGNYRLYTGSDLDRSLLDAPHTASAAEVLRRRMVELGKTIEQLREHQQAIARLLQIKSFTRSNKMITKEKWVAVMRSAGFTDEDMHRWHTEFEKSAPAEHQEFLEFLHIPAAEIAKIRDWSRLQS